MLEPGIGDGEAFGGEILFKLFQELRKPVSADNGDDMRIDEPSEWNGLVSRRRGGVMEWWIDGVMPPVSLLRQRHCRRRTLRLVFPQWDHGRPAGAFLLLKTGGSIYHVAERGRGGGLMDWWIIGWVE